MFKIDFDLKVNARYQQSYLFFNEVERSECIYKILSQEKIKEKYLKGKYSEIDLLYFVSNWDECDFDFMLWYIRSHNIVSPADFMFKSSRPKMTFEKLYNLLMELNIARINGYIIYKSVKNPRENFYKTKLIEMGCSVKNPRYYPFTEDVQSAHVMFNFTTLLKND
jgi:hypothetical protein